MGLNPVLVIVSWTLVITQCKSCMVTSCMGQIHWTQLHNKGMGHCKAIMGIAGKVLHRVSPAFLQESLPASSFSFVLFLFCR